MFLRLTIFVFLAAAATTAMAQQTIFNVPTTDVLNRGQVYVEVDAAFKPSDSDAVTKFSSFVPRVVVGTGRNIEIGLNVTGNIQPGADSTTLSPTIKWRFFNDQKRGFAMVAGTNLYVPVRNRGYRFGSYSYVEASKTIHKTRLTAGGYVASNNVFAPNAARAGGQFGFEQTVNKYLNINADWITGRHGAGYFTPGVALKPHSRVTAYLGYSVGNANAAHGNHYALFELGYNFN